MKEIPYLFDLETMPLPMDELQKLMPENLVSDKMPDEIANPEMPDFGQPPKYGGDLEKQALWLKEKQDKWKVASEIKKQEWKIQLVEGRQRFINRAALEAETATIKLAGIRNMAAGITTVCIAGATEAEVRIVEAGAFPCKAEFVYCKDETELLTHLSAFAQDRIQEREFTRGVIPRTVVRVPTVIREGGKLIGYNIADWDFRMWFRRCWMLGVKPPSHLRQNARYFDSKLYVDIREEWCMGDRQEATGGLDGLCQLLGVKRKTGSGEFFWRMWRDNPAEAIAYHLNEMQSLEEVVKRMGII